MLAGRPFQERDGQRVARLQSSIKLLQRRIFWGQTPSAITLRCGFAHTLERDRGHSFRFPAAQSGGRFEATRILPGSANATGRWSMAIRVRAASDIGNGRRAHQQLASTRGSAALLGCGQYAAADSRFRIADIAPTNYYVACLLSALGTDIGCRRRFWRDLIFRRERTREIGIRSALGAGRSEIAGLVLRESLGVALGGVALGTFGALVVTRLFRQEHRLERIGNLSLRRLPNGQPYLFTDSRAADECRACRVVGAGAEGHACRSHGRLRHE